MTLAKLTLVLGGAASGKSLFAENLLCAHAAKQVYIATAQAFDEEMRQKISAHRSRRGDDWRTVEAPLDVPSALQQAKAGEAILLDCATLWLTNHLMAGNDLADETDRLLSALAACTAPVIVVSNETGMGVVPENSLSRAFRQAQGELNQRLAAQADLAVFVLAGLPMLLKGTLPKGTI